MATFLTRDGITHHIHEIIKSAKERLILISPYIKADDATIDLLSDKRRGTPIHIIYGKSKLKRAQDEQFKQLGITILFHKDLHAKCYLNENTALVTSMNLHEYSQKNNDEMGILVERQEDPDLYAAIAAEAERLKNPDPSASPAKAAAPTQQKKPRKGFCIRCGNELAANPKKPYCTTCRKSWNRYKNREYEEKYCHECGKEHATSMASPLCPDCSRRRQVTAR